MYKTQFDISSGGFKTSMDSENILTFTDHTFNVTDELGQQHFTLPQDITSNVKIDAEINGRGQTETLDFARNIVTDEIDFLTMIPQGAFIKIRVWG